MKSLRTLSFSLVAVVVALAGCSADNAQSGTTDTPHSVQAKSTIANGDGAESGGRGRHGFGGFSHGPGSLVVAALHENINLTAEQRATIEALQRKSHAAWAPLLDKTRVTALAAQIRAGKIDTTAMTPLTRDENAMGEHMALASSNLKTLHDTLSKEQRTALVDAILAKHAKGPDGERKRDHKGAHADVERGGERHMGLHRGPVASLLQDIALTPEQKETLRAKLEASRPTKPSDADRDAMKARFTARKQAMDTKLRSFVNDGFDAAAFVTPPADAANMGPENRRDRMAKELSILVSVLTDAQRDQLAKKIEAGPPGGPQWNP